MNSVTLAEAKAKFLAACDVWADLLIEDSAQQVKRGGERWQLDDMPEWLPKIAYRGGNEPLPESQRKVWAAGYHLLMDSYDAIEAEG